jgi:hypothetical protein
LEVYETDFMAKGGNRKELLDKIDEITKKQRIARELLLKGDLDGTEYREIKNGM